MKKRIIFFNILICLIITISNISFGAFADFDDEAAKEQTQKLIQEQEKNENQTAEKSNNNYLSSLSVDNYKLTPEFDKQIQEYKIEENLNVDKIKINAELEDERASLSGNGEVQLEKGQNKLRVEVTSQRGSVRTYIINVNYGEEQAKEETKQTTEIIEEPTKPAIEEKINEVKSESNNNYMIIIIACICLAVLIILIILKKHKNNKHGKRYR